jgi:cytochrome c-type biogenesis protein CcmH/NrfG
MPNNMIAITLLGLFLAPVPLIGQSQTNAQPESESHMRLAQQYLGQHRPDLAIPELEQVVAANPENAEAQGNLGVLLFFRPDYGEAAKHLRAATTINPDLWKVRALLGLAEGHLGDAVGSRRDLEIAFPNITEDKIKDQVGQALIANYNATAELEKAANVVSVMLTSRPTDANLQYTAYRIYSDLVDKSMLTVAILAPDSARMHLVMGRELARHGDEAPAIENYREAVRLDPHFPGIHSEFAQLLYSSQNETIRAQAAAEYKLALELNPDDEKAQLMLGVIAAKKGDIAAAYADDSRAVQMQSGDSDAAVELAKVLIQMKQPEKAQALLEQVAANDPSNYVAHFHLGRVYMRQGKSDQAKQQVDLYKKYRDMHDRLQNIFNDMRVTSGRNADHDDDTALR